MATWAYSDVRWGLTECARKACSAPSELLYDGLPLCVDCAERLLDRQCALERYPDLRELLPAWGE